MADTTSIENAKRVFATVIKTLNNRKWTYVLDEEKLKVSFDVYSDDLPMELMLCVVPELDAIACISRMPFDVPKNKAPVACVVVNMLNLTLTIGSFEYDHNNDCIAYRTCSNIRDTIVGCGMIDDIIDDACYMVDEYNDKFLLLFKDKITVNEFFADDEED